MSQVLREKSLVDPLGRKKKAKSPAFPLERPFQTFQDFNCSLAVCLRDGSCENIAWTRRTEGNSKSGVVPFRDVLNCGHFSIGQIRDGQGQLFFPVASKRNLKQGPSIANECQYPP